MLRVSKVVPPQKTIIKDISLSFFPGAKIGLPFARRPSENNREFFGSRPHSNRFPIKPPVKKGRLNIFSDGLITHFKP